MKKVILFAMIAILFFSGCNSSDDSDIERPDISFGPLQTAENNLNSEQSEPDKTPDIQKAIPEIFDPVYLLSIFQPAYSKDGKYYNLLSWQEYIHSKLGVEINIFNKSKELKGAQAVYYFNYRVGYPYSSSSAVFEYIDSEKSHDLSPYYFEYEWNDIIDPSYIKELSSVGQIFAVPTYPNKYIIPRYYNSIYLNKLNIDVPTDINSFHNYLIESKKIMSGEGILLPMFIPQRFQFPCLSDIFRAYDVYVNSEYQSAMSFNPKTQSYEDAVFSDNIAMALEFIKGIQKQELMGIFGEYSYRTSDGKSSNQYIGDRFRVNKTFATEYYMTYDKEANWFQKFLLTKPDYDFECGYYLSHLNTDKICEIRSDMGFYVFPKNIQNLSGTVDLFSTIMTDTEYYADLLYGEEGTDYVIIDDVIYPNLPDLGTFPGIRLLVSNDDRNSYYKPDNISMANQIADRMLYESNIFNQIFSGRYSYIVGNGSISGDFHEKLFATEISSTDAIENYKDWFFSSGSYQAIVDINEKIGTTPAYDYTP